MAVISTQISSAASPSGSAISPTGVADATTQTTAANSNNNPQNTTVTLSGQALMLSRLFNTTDPNAPPEMSGVNGMSLTNIGRSPVSFLTSSDLTVLSNMYGYAQQQGADLQYVDQIAVALGSYRQENDGRTMISFNAGSFDLAGHQMTVNFNAQDAATATSILNGTAINSTELDHGFLRYTLNPGFGALTYNGSMQFLQQMVVKFSGEGTANMTLDPKFSTYTPVSINDKVVFTASKEILNPNPAATFVADYTSINGVGHWRTPELAAAAAASPDGIPSAASLNAITVNKLLGNVQPQATTKTSLLTTLLDLMSKSNATKK